MKPRPNARLIGLNQAAAEFGLPYGTLYTLIKRGDLPSVQLPGVRRIYLDRRDLERALDVWKAVQR
jgi:excisionase family DNA binding protein